MFLLFFSEHYEVIIIFYVRKIVYQERYNFTTLFGNLEKRNEFLARVQCKELKSQLACAILHTKFENSSLGVEKLSFSLDLVLIFRKISYSTTMEICYR